MGNFHLKFMHCFKDITVFVLRFFVASPCMQEMWPKKFMDSAIKTKQLSLKNLATKMIINCQ